MFKLIYKKEILAQFNTTPFVLPPTHGVEKRKKIIKKELPRCSVLRSSHQKVSVPPLYLPEPILLSSKIVISTYRTQLRNIARCLKYKLLNQHQQCKSLCSDVDDTMRKDTTLRPLSMGSVNSRPLGAKIFSFWSLMYLAIFFKTWTETNNADGRIINLFITWKKKTSRCHCWVKAFRHWSGLYLFIVRLHAEKDCVSSQTSQTTLQIRLSSKFLCLCVKVVEGLDGFFKLLLIELKTHKGFQLIFMIAMFRILLTPSQTTVV